MDFSPSQEESEISASDTIAVVGMACRFAGGVDSPDSLWDFVMAGSSAVGEVPAERWEPYSAVSPRHATRLRSSTRYGGFLSDIRGFDADFFGISPREAELMDPQQRIVLEVSWEALEHAGISVPSLAGSDAGVFIGVGSDDYGRRLLEDIPTIEAWTGIGSSYCGVPNRVSYAFDLRGPSMAIDTACSASLVAVHLACQSLRAGESSLALAGGVLIMSGPGLTVVLDAAGAMAPDGRCKSFDAAADGYGRGEGAGVIVLKRLIDARRDGDRVLALIRGSAVHQDGKTNGIMAPSQQAQEHLLRRAYRMADVSPATVGYVEAHGTGTPVGDPIEVGAIATVIGGTRPRSRPCLIGSLKPNIGHLEAGAGIAGIIKTVLALHKNVIPPTAGLVTPNPAINWQESGLSVVTEPTDWMPAGHPRRAGVSGFGYGGTIAHVVLEEAHPDAFAGARGPQEGEELIERVFPVSCASPAGVRAYAARLADWLDKHPAASPADVQYTLARRRAHLRARAAVVARTTAELASSLRGVASGSDDATAATGHRQHGRPDLVWVFSGHGAQWGGMGRELLGTEPAFATAIDKIDEIFVEEIGFSPRRVIESGQLDRVDVIQALIFAVQIGLSAVWRSRGVRPDAVIGHSVGEIAAAVTAGILTPEEGARLVCRRSRLLAEVAGQGAMFMVNLGFDQAARRLEPAGGPVAAISASVSSTVVAGDAAAVEALAARWRDHGLVIRRVDSDVAFHSPHMDRLVPRLRQSVQELIPRRPRLPIYSTALDDPRSPLARDGDYWAANLRNPVRFSEAVSAAIGDGYRNFLEISAHPVVAHSIEETAAALGTEVLVAHSLRRARPQTRTLLANHAQLYCTGTRVDWSVRATDGELLDLPLTAWQHRPFWARSGPSAAGSPGLPHDPDSHTLLGAPTVAHGSPAVCVWQTRLDAESRPYPGLHPVKGVEIVPAAVLLNTFRTAGGQRPIGDVRLRTPVPVTAPRDVQVVRQGDSLRLVARLADTSDRAWLTHSAATLLRSPLSPPADMRPAESRRRCAEELDPGYPVDRLGLIGVAAMGFDWRVIQLMRGTGELFAEVEAPPATIASALDAALSIGSVVFDGPPALRMPAHIERVDVIGECPERVLISARTVSGAVDTIDLDIADPGGRILIALRGLRYSLLEREPDEALSPERLVYELRLRPAQAQPRPAGEAVGRPPYLMVFGDEPAAMARQFTELGVPAASATTIGALARLAARAPAGSVVLIVPPVPDREHLAGEAALRGSRQLVQVASRLAGRRLRVWCLTRGVHEGVTAAALAHSSLHGLGRVAAGELPDLWGAVVDIEAGLPDEGVGRLLLPVLAAEPADDVLVVRGGEVFVQRLAPVSPAGSASGLTCRADGTYLVTGGLGVLGLEVASWLASRGARRLILAGRAGLPPRAEWDTVRDPAVQNRVSAVRALEAQGVTVCPLSLDIADPLAVASAIAACGLPPVLGIVHAAGVLDSKMIGDVDEASLSAVLRPKVAGALTLHQMFPPGSVDFMVFFSSCGQLLGLTGQASYASGNAFLDGLARMRRRDGHADAMSLAWTSWRGLGMSVSSEVIDLELAARGAAGITSSEAFDCWDFAARHGGGHYVVLRVLPPEAGLVPAPVLAEVPRASADAAAAAGPAAAQAQPGWQSVDPAELPSFLTGQVRALVAGELRLDPAELDMDRPLTELGLDSVMLTVIRRRLERQLGRGLPATLLWEYPTAAAVTGHLTELLAGSPVEAGDRG
jgi:6-methylsalicylic acid synthase